MKICTVLVVTVISLVSDASADSSRPFLFLKTGEKFATQEIAGPTVAGLTGYLGEKVMASTNTFAPMVMNDPVKAAEISSKSKPALGIVTAGFYLTYAKALGMDALLEVNVAGVKDPRYVLVTRKSAADDLSKLEGKTIATPLAAEQRYVVAVVLQGKLGEEVRLKQTMDVESAVFDLADGSKSAADAVLLDAGAWDLFKDDPESGGKLKVIYQSDELPRDLVVVFGVKSDSPNVSRMRQILKDMSHDEAGQNILRSIRVESFVDIDQGRLSKAEKLFYGK